MPNVSSTESRPWYGFNFQWIFREDHATPRAERADEAALDAITDWGFNFVRIPADYRFWASSDTYEIHDEGPLELIDGYVEQCRARGLHLSLNMHRVPGYCINGARLEGRNLWTSETAQDAVCELWRGFAERYRDVPNEDLSFDLINEMPNLGQLGFTADIHQRLIRRIAAEIRAVSPERTIVIDGIDGGHTAIPELADCSDVQSGRGYAPSGLSHFGSDWWDTAAGLEPDDEVRKQLGLARDEWWLQATGGKGPAYPGEIDGQHWDIDGLRAHFEPWTAVERGGSRVHIGEMGCYQRVPAPTALAWMSDMLTVFGEHRWGWALWNFDGPFGVVNSGRDGIRTIRRNGFTVDADLLDLLQEKQVR